MSLVPTVRTPITPGEYARGVIGAWQHVGSGTPLEAAVAVLYAQCFTETGGRDLWNHNIGNVKHVAGDGYDHCVLHGVWEGVSAAEAKRLISAGLAVADTNPSHIRAVAPRVAVVLTPENPGSWFRAYDSFEHAMRSHLQFLSRVYGSAWPKVLAGDPVGFAYALRARVPPYFTASAEAYAAIMRPAFDAFVRSTAYEDAIAERDFGDTLPAAPALKDWAELEHDGVLWRVAPTGVGPIAIDRGAELAAAMGWELPTPELVDAIWEAADLRIEPITMSPNLGNSPAQFAEHEAKLRAAIAGRPFRLLAGSHKDIAQKDGRVGLYGMHRLSGRRWQDFYDLHVPEWIDYSQRVRGCYRATRAPIVHPTLDAGDDFRRRPIGDDA